MVYMRQFSHPIRVFFWPEPNRTATGNCQKRKIISEEKFSGPCTAARSTCGLSRVQLHRCSRVKSLKTEEWRLLQQQINTHSLGMRSPAVTHEFCVEYFALPGLLHDSAATLNSFTTAGIPRHNLIFFLLPPSLSC